MPFKGFFAPKHRLAPLLSLAERRGLARAMLIDVVAALRGATGLSRVVVVSRDQAALELAAALGAEPLREDGRPGYRAAATQAARSARQAGAEGLLVVPADVPLLRSVEVEQLLALSCGAAVTLVASRSGGGTNALLTRPPDALPYRFGVDSFQAHLRAANRRGLQVATREVAGLAVDVDEAEDVRWVLEGGETETRRYLEGLEMGHRSRVMLSIPRRR